ncbi:helix-turn-helix domain-containing protein [Acetivibrio straminisolvens]|jgi:transcriptional regulator with XRE-family HTH domain|uniref:helix-turn-helix domain-containing protein n=1 Tax=Acetivibrio straminisolvens TaxID=253314 RepID=UPI00223F1258|nr:helix-turn-helix transcriptional regulator [Acetivibrio straminisolvens]
MCVGEKIKQYLKENNITQTELSIDTRIPLPKLNLSLSGKRILKLEEYEIICGVLGVNVDKFLAPRLPERKSNANHKNVS